MLPTSFAAHETGSRQPQDLRLAADGPAMHSIAWRLRLSAYSWLAWPISAGAVIVAAWTAPEAGAAAVLGYWIVGAAGLTWARRRMSSAGSRHAWGWMALTAVGAVTGNVVRLVHGLIVGVEFPMPSVADPIIVATYAAFATAEVLFVRYRSAGREVDTWLNSTLLAVAIGFVLWTSIMSRYITDPSAPAAERVMNGTYFMIQIVVLATTLRLLSARGVRSASYHLLAAGTTVLVAADLAGSLAFAHGTDPFPIVITNTLTLGLVTGAAFHPRVEQLTAAPDDIEPKEEGRLWPLSCLSLMLPTVVLLAADGPLTMVRRVEAVAGTILLAVLLVTRGIRLVDGRARLLSRANELARIADEMKGQSPETLDAMLSPLACRILDTEPIQVSKMTLTDHQTLALAGLPPGVLDRLRSGTDVRKEGEVRGVGAVGRYFFLPAWHQSDVWVAVVTDAVLSRHERLALRSLVRSWSAAHLAAESSKAAAAHLAERQWTRALVESEKRQRALLENSGTITAILSEDQSISYVSQPIVSILGHSPTSAIGTLVTHFIADAESATRWRGAWERCVDGGSATDEIRFIHRDGESRILEVVLNDHRGSELINGVVFNARDISATRDLEERVGRDDITSALNRRAFLAFLREAPCDVVLITVKEWRMLSRSASTEQVDEILSTIADRLIRVLRFEDKLARIDGATFAVALRSAAAPAIPATVARLREVVSRPLAIDDLTLTLDTAVGHAPHETVATELLNHAHLALAQALTSRADYETFRPTSVTAYELELDILGRLGEAIATGEFELHYQPIVALDTATVKGVEALIRWRHPLRGLVPPVEFIPIVEQHSSLMSLLGDWIIDTAAQQASEWLRGRVVDETFTLSINISGVQMDERLIQTFADATERHDIPPSMLTIEVTETVLSDAPELEARVLVELRRAGHSLAIDDFGTGTANLARLRELHPDIVKLDRSLISPIEIEEDAVHLLARSIEIAHAMGARVTVEGVETIGQATTARDLGCEHAQGYYFARPGPPDARLLTLGSPASADHKRV